MKAISFEMIRNLLRTKKKRSDDYGDASFKRSDSFKRISIRRSYMNRGRKRSMTVSKSSIHHINQLNGKLHSAYSTQEPEPTDVQYHPKSFDKKSVVSELINKNHNNNSNGNSLGNVDLTRFDESLMPIQQCINTAIEVNEHRHEKTKSSKKSYRNIKDSSTNVSGVIDSDRHKLQEWPCKIKRNKYDELTTSTNCFIRASNMLKKPIGTGLDVTATDSIERSPNELRYSHDSFLDVRETLDNTDSTNLKYQNIVCKSPQFNTDGLILCDISQKMPECTQSPNTNSSNCFNDCTVVSSTISEDAWKVHETQSIDRKSVINNSTLNISDDRSLLSADDEMPSFVIFKTYSNEKSSSGYLKTCFNYVENEDKKKLHNVKPILSNNYTKKRNGNDNDDEHDDDDDDDNNVATPLVRSEMSKRISIKNEHGAHRKGKGVVIQISDSGCNIDNLSQLQIKEALIKKVSCDSALGDNLPDYSEDETSLNGKFTFEIYKQIQTNKMSDNLTSIKCMLDNCDKLSGSQSARQQIKTLNESFTSMHICEKIDNNFFLEPDTQKYASGVNDIPYPLRIKTNPFTNQKEPYSVNLGRVWKQLNLGQDDQSAETSIEKPTTTKFKNDSFRSVSSHDSGFSLTLTKQKSIFNRKQQKKSKRSAKFIAPRVSQLKKISTIPRNAGKYSKKSKFKPQIMPVVNSNLQSTLKTNNPMKTKCIKNKPKEEESVCEPFLNKIELELQTNEKKQHDYSFSQEINDLEAFFEEHLKRLKDYYVQKKRNNDQVIKGIGGVCSKCENEKEKENEKNDFKLTSPTEIPLQTHSNQSIELVKMNSSLSVYLNHHFNNTHYNSVNRNVNEMLTNDIVVTKKNLSHDLSSGKTALNFSTPFDFPHPDKRLKTNRKNLRAQSNNLKYASLEFGNKILNKNIDTDQCSMELNEKNCHNNDDELFKDKQSMFVNFNSSSEFLFDDSNNEDKYEDILNDENYSNRNECTESDVCVLCDKIQSECECSMYRKLANFYSITPENIFCACISALNAPVLKSNQTKCSKTVQRCSTGKCRPSTYKAKRIKRKNWHPKNHSLRREYVASKCIISEL